ncbi:MAG: alkaline phosphatase family protein [Lachnospiraceae bacterium]|nr:alkaline phosphatase family protein [Lachnospiraceae bacterium]
MLKKKNFFVAMLITFLITFMWLVFGPAEIFFANVTEFDFIYGEFFWHMAVITIVVTLVVSLLVLILPEKVSRALLSVMFALAVMSYIQVMFFNQKLDLLGESAEGYELQTGKAVFNLIIWIVICLAVIVLAYLKKDIWKKLVLGASGFLLAIQAVAYVSLLLTADEEAYKRPDGFWMLSGEEQYVVSGEENIIIFVLDCFNNQYVDIMNEAYPGSTDFLHDFTYYNNADCTYYGTFPSLPHMLTGCEVREDMTVNDWCSWIWDNEKTNSFYEGLQTNNYITNIYTADAQVLVGTNPKGILSGKINNAVNSSAEMEVDYELLIQTLMKMSGYRLVPDLFKGYLYTDIDEYESIVRLKENPINYNNYDYYERLVEQKLSINEEHNYFIVEHLVGTHSYSTDEFGHYSEDAVLADTAKGCMVIVEEYLNQLKELGVYDNSTIIITSDHGVEDESQVIFFVKQPGESHEESPITSAPIAHTELLPTIAQAAGMNPGEYGQTIYDFGDGEERERTVWVRTFDDAYPSVPCYTGDKEGSSNVYYGYSYVGNLQDLLEQIGSGPAQIMEMKDSHY